MKIISKTSLLFLFSFEIFAGSTNSIENRFYEVNKRIELREHYPFFDGMPPGISEDDIRRTDEWEAHSYSITKRNDKGERELLPIEKIVKNRLEARPYSRIGGFPRYTTLGQLTKQCDGIFIGVMTDIQSEDISHKPDHRKGEVFSTKIKFQVETNLFGQTSGETVTISMSWIDGKTQMPSIGLRILVFYAQGYKIDIFDRSLIKFYWVKPPAISNEPPTMLFRDWNTSMRVLETPAVEKTYIETVNGYLQIFRREKRSPIKYYEFLKPLVKSPVWRIRQDAREDMLLLLRHEGEDMFDLKVPLEDPELLSFYKDYINYILLPKRVKQSEND